MNTEIIGANAGTVWVALNGAEALGVKPEDEKEFIISLVQDC